jgi:hypothetical protein
MIICTCTYKSHASTARNLSNTSVVEYNTGVSQQSIVAFAYHVQPGPGMPPPLPHSKMVLGLARGRLALLAHQRRSWPGCVAFVQCEMIAQAVRVPAYTHVADEASVAAVACRADALRDADTALTCWHYIVKVFVLETVALEDSLELIHLCTKTVDTINILAILFSLSLTIFLAHLLAVPLSCRWRVAGTADGQVSGGRMMADKRAGGRWRVANEWWVRKRLASEGWQVAVGSSPPFALTFWSCRKVSGLLFGLTCSGAQYHWARSDRTQASASAKVFKSGRMR